MDALVCRLMSLCVNLESLVIEDCVGPENLKICSSTLLELSLWNFEDDPVERVNSVEIRAPNLCSLSIICLEMETFSLDSSPCIIEANVKYASRREQFEYWSKVVRSLTGVMSLTTHNWWFEVFFSSDTAPCILLFSLLTGVHVLTVRVRCCKTPDIRFCASGYEICDHYVMLMP